MGNTPQIQVSNDYDRFKFMGGNRNVNRNHVELLKREMLRNPHLFATNPILINEHSFIVDGQHRVVAASELKRPVYYIVGDGMTVSDARHLNVAQKNWAIMDFAKSYADGGNIHYKKFIEIRNEYPQVSPHAVLTMLYGTEPHGLAQIFRDGRFVVGSEDKAREMLDIIVAIGRNLDPGTRLNTPMIRSLGMLIKADNEFDPEVLIRKLERKSVREVFVIGTTVKACLQSIENAYNFQSKTRTILY